MRTNTLSVCMVIKDEKEHLEKALLSIVGVADEIIVVDTGSTDGSLTIARRFADQVIETVWEDDFSAARNLALDHASGEWVLFLDGDEELEPGSIEPLRQRLKNEEAEGYLLRVLNLYGSGGQTSIVPDVVFRLFRNKKEYRYSGCIHEQIADNITRVNPGAKIYVAEDVTIIHYGYLAEIIDGKNKAARNVRLLERQVADNPESILDRFHLGIEYLRSDRFGEALDHFLFVRKRADPKSLFMPKLMRCIATCLYFEGRLNEALRFIEEDWLKCFPDQADLHDLRATISRDLGDYVQAYESLTRCLELVEQPPHYASICSYNRERIYYQLGAIAEHFADKESALIYYKEALRHNPGFLEALARIVHILEPRRHPEYTQEALHRVFEFSEPAAKAELARLYYREGAFRLAIEALASFREEELPADLLFIKGFSLMAEGDAEGAFACLCKIPKNDDNFIPAQKVLFLSCWANGKTKEAWGYLEEILACPGAERIALTCELLLKQDGVSDDERADAGAAFEVLTHLVQMGLLHEFDRASERLLHVFSEYPALELAQLLYRYGYYERAEREYRKYMATAEEPSLAFYPLGLCCWRLERLKEAEYFIGRAIAMGMAGHEANLIMARLYQEMALEVLREGLTEKEKGSELRALIEEIEQSLIEV